MIPFSRYMFCVLFKSGFIHLHLFYINLYTYFLTLQFFSLFPFIAQLQHPFYSFPSSAIINSSLGLAALDSGHSFNIWCHDFSPLSHSLHIFLPSSCQYLLPFHSFPHLNLAIVFNFVPFPFHSKYFALSFVFHLLYSFVDFDLSIFLSLSSNFFSL